VVKDHWDVNKTPNQNMASMGLLASPNQLLLTNSDNKTTESSVKSGVVELFDVPESDAPSRKSRFPLTDDEEKYMAMCMAKWGDDYTAMFRDIKVNTLQHTEEKLRKMGSRFLLLTSEQRRVQVPENVKDLLPDP
jgi:Ribosome biogenesis protein Nop16